LLETYEPWLRRFKAVFRTGRGPSWLNPERGRGLHGEDSAYRRDSRLEIVLAVKLTRGFPRRLAVDVARRGVDTASLTVILTIIPRWVL